MANFRASVLLLPIKTLFRLARNTKYIDYLLINCLKEYENNSDFYASFIKRPKYANKFVSIEEPCYENCNTAIIMQGPLVKENDYTVETVKLYDKIYPGSKIIVSTWENEDLSIINELLALSNCTVLLNKYPIDCGNKEGC